MNTVFVNRNVLFARGLLTVWLLGLALGTWVLVRDWGTLDASTQRYGMGFVALMWMVGVPSWWWFGFRQPIVRLMVLPDQRLRLTRGMLLGSSTTELTKADLEGVELIEGTDSDGDAYFKGILMLKVGRERVVFTEGRNRDQVLEAVNAVRAAVGVTTSSAQP